MEIRLTNHTASESRRNRLKCMLTPKSAVFVGGSSTVPAIDYCRQRGFGGRIYVVNQTRSKLAGIECLRSVASLPEIPDLAYVAVPRNNVVELVRELSAHGVSGAVCNTAGFAEMQGGQKLQHDLIEAAGGMPIIGPNCPGVANFADRSVFMMGHFGDHDGDCGVAFVSNGGSYLSDVGCADRSLPVAYSIGVGNQAMVNAADIMDILLDDHRVQAINLYLEGIPNPTALSAAGLKAARKGVPVVVVKGGRTNAGRRATLSHTASLAGDHIIASALFRRLGFVEAQTPTEALETLKLLIHTSPIKGRRTAFATSSGTYAVLGSDIAETNGLDLQPPSRQASAELKKYLPPFVHAANPLDISSAHDSDFDVHLNIYRAYLSDEHDIALQVMCFPPAGGCNPRGWNMSTRAFAQAARERDMPAAFINTLPEALPTSAREQMIAEGLAPLMGMEDGLRAVSNAMRLTQLAGYLADRPDEEILVPQDRICGGDGEIMDDANTKAELRACGIKVPHSIIVDPNRTDELTTLRFPVVVRLVGAGPYKTDLHSVVSELDTPEATRRAMTAMAQKLIPSLPKWSYPTFLVEELVPDAVGQLRVQLRGVDRIGLILTISMGCSEAELLCDTATILLPASRATIAEALRSLKLFPLLDGWRGGAVGDVEAAIDAIQMFAQFGHENRERVSEADINSLIVRPKGQGVVAADAVIVACARKGLQFQQ
ncbi:acetate--CoA ligase family protein [Mesorhizobium sp. M0118]|uniref:acetate--CoA ligase family protein n=1 Tax=Mesorhizobium sp. M0118 TaxID=2956884 RepID=UPI003336CFB9